MTFVIAWEPFPPYLVKVEFGERINTPSPIDQSNGKNTSYIVVDPNFLFLG